MGAKAWENAYSEARLVNKKLNTPVRIRFGSALFML